MMDHLPFWPRFLSRGEAARYLGVSPDTFALEVGAGTWPPGRPRGGKGGKLTWDRIMLDRAADRQADLVESFPAGRSGGDEAVAEVERRIDGQAEKQRHQHRHQAPA